MPLTMLVIRWHHVCPLTVCVSEDGCGQAEVWLFFQTGFIGFNVFILLMQEQWLLLQQAIAFQEKKAYHFIDEVAGRRVSELSTALLWDTDGWGTQKCYHIMVRRTNDMTIGWKYVKSSIKCPKRNHYILFILDGEVMIHMLTYDPKSSVWTMVPPMQIPRSDSAMCALKGKIYVIGILYTSS